MKKVRPTFEYELEFSRDGEIIVAGVDEVGRGALAGPIVAAAVVFDLKNSVICCRSTTNYTITDSKLLTKRQRQKSEKAIRKIASDIGIGVVEVAEIDKFGIGAANVLAFKRALDNLKVCDLALIDGRRFRGFDRKYRTIIRGESKSISIAAASIIAKVFRDDLMTRLHKEFKIYNFAKNLGYGTSHHLRVIQKHGPSPHHRRSFLRKINHNINIFE